MSSTLAVAGGSWIIVVFAVVMVIVMAYSYYSIRGSGIDAHPSDGLGGAPGAAGPSDAAKGRGSEGDTDDGGAGGTFSSHGTG